MTARYKIVELSVSTAESEDLAAGGGYDHNIEVYLDDESEVIVSFSFSSMSSEEWLTVKEAVDAAIELFGPAYRGRRRKNKKAARLLLKDQQDTIIHHLILLDTILEQATEPLVFEDEALDLKAVRKNNEKDIADMMELLSS